ncbi:MAG: hypothetical protein KY429_04575 [Actinobacteria bacterium]|nr:hypothetical protein [Actinomycetota bacterium]
MKTSDMWPRAIQGVLIGSLAYWVLHYFLVPDDSSPGSYRLLLLSLPITVIGVLLSRQEAYRWLGIGFVLAAAGSPIYYILR